MEGIKGQRYNIIHSVKGGAGKTTFSILLTMYLVAKNHKTLLVDSDFRGSSLEKLLSTMFPCEQKGTFVSNMGLYLEKKTDISRIISKIKTNSSEERVIDVILAPQTVEEKRRFSFNPATTEMPSFNIFEFQEMFKCFLDELEQFLPDGVDTKEGYSEIVFDLSPSTDEYSQQVLKSLLERKSGKEKIDLRTHGFELRNYEEVSTNVHDVVYYLLTTPDSSHINLTCDYAVSILENSLRRPGLGKIVIVLNQLSDVYDFVGDPVQMLEKYLLQKLDKKKEFMEKICIIKTEPQPSITRKAVHPILRQMNESDESISVDFLTNQLLNLKWYKVSE